MPGKRCEPGCTCLRHTRSGRRPRERPAEEWFREWYNAMPEPWQRAFDHARAGEVCVLGYLAWKGLANVKVIFAPAGIIPAQIAELQEPPCLSAPKPIDRPASVPANSVPLPPNAATATAGGDIG